MAKNFRLYISSPLISGTYITLSPEQTHYLKNVVKYEIGDELTCFDNKNGDFSCEITELNKKDAKILVKNQLKLFTPCPDIWLLFAPLKKDKTDFVIEKATELGVSCIVPIITKYTITQNIKTERYIAQSIEAAEQCRRTDLPQIRPAQYFSDIFKDWEQDRTLFFMDETLESQNFLDVLNKPPSSKKSALLIGPEGGFSKEELNFLRNQPYAQGATLGPRILRAETAVAAALSCWQLILGDWSNK